MTGLGGHVEVTGSESPPMLQWPALYNQACSPNQLGWSDEGSPPPHRLWFPSTLFSQAVSSTPLGAALWSSLLCHQVQQWQVPSLPAKGLVALSHRLRARATRSFPFSSFRPIVEKMGLFVTIGISSHKGCTLCHVGHFRKPVKHSPMQSEGPSLSRSPPACVRVPCLFLLSLCPPSFPVPQCS